MALDVQANWTISMAENLKQMQRGGSRSKEDVGSAKDNHGVGKKTAKLGVETEAVEWTTSPIYLPDEILVQVLEYVSRSRDAQRTLASCCRLSKQWYDVAVPLLYRHPNLYGKNFDPFVRAICPSINLHVRKSPLSGLVRTLDMGNLVHQGSRSMTARLLGRTKGNLEHFVAPQSSFAMNCFPALSKCHHLQSLNLSLVSESPPLPELFKTVAHLEQLRTFRLPRSAGFGVHHKPESFVWPPNLEDLALSGGIDGHFLSGVIAFPQTLRRLTLEHCPQVRAHAVSYLLRTGVRPLRNLESLTVRNMPQLGSHALNDVLLLMPQIKKLSISVDYITPAFFDETDYHHVKMPRTVPVWSDPLSPGVSDMDGEFTTLHDSELQTLELTNSGKPGVEDKITPIDIMIALDDGSFPRLRQVRVAKSLLWHSNVTKDDAEALAAALQEGSKKDWEMKEGVFAAMGEREYRATKWEDVAGVWAFDG